MVKKGLSIYILTKNSEESLKRTLESVKFADEIVIVDGYSTDDTLKIAQKYTKKIHQREFEGFHKERNFALKKCNYEWVFGVDSDEIVPPELRSELQEFVKRERGKNGYVINRNENFMGRRLFVTNKTPRLFRKGTVTFKGNVHEWPEYEGETGILKNPIEHYSYSTIHQMIEKTQRESDAEVDKIRSLSKTRTALRIFTEHQKWFWGMLLWKKLLFKGMPGWIYSYYSGAVWFSSYAKYYEKNFMQKKSV